MAHAVSALSLTHIKGMRCVAAQAQELGRRFSLWGQYLWLGFLGRCDPAGHYDPVDHLAVLLGSWRHRGAVAHLPAASDNHEAGA